MRQFVVFLALVITAVALPMLAGPRQSAGRADSAVAVRHDDLDRLSPGIGAAVLGGPGLDRGGGDRPGAERIHHSHGRRGHGHFAGRTDSQPLETDLRRHLRGLRGAADDDRRRYAGRAAVLHGGSARCPAVRPVVAVGRDPDERRAVAAGRAIVRRADRLEPAGAGRHFASAAARIGAPRAGHLQPFDQRGLDRRGGGRKHRTPRACWSAWGPIFTTSAKCSSRAISSKTRDKTPAATTRWCRP